MGIDWEPIEPVPREAQEMARAEREVLARVRTDIRVWQDAAIGGLVSTVDSLRSALREAEDRLRQLEFDVAVPMQELREQLRESDERDKEYTRQLYAWQAAHDRLREALEQIAGQLDGTGDMSRWPQYIARAALADQPGDCRDSNREVVDVPADQPESERRRVKIEDDVRVYPKVKPVPADQPEEGG